MANIFTVYELHSVTGDELGNYDGNLGYFKTKETANQAGQLLNHPFWKIKDRYAVELASGEVFLLKQVDSISFGMKKR